MAQKDLNHLFLKTSRAAMIDNLETYWGKADKVETCYFCQNMAKYNDVAQIEQTYQIVGVCECHSFKGLTS